MLSWLFKAYDQPDVYESEDSPNIHYDPTSNQVWTAKGFKK